MIRISNLCKIIKDRKILNNINLNLPSSGIVVLCGENGSGKTTLLNIIGMMDDNYDGDILFDASKPDGTMRKLTDVSKLHALGWKHSIEIEEGVERLYSWYLQNL